MRLATRRRARREPDLQTAVPSTDVVRVQVSSPEYACLLLDALSCGVVAIDEAGRLCAVNPDARRILGCPVGEGSALLGEDCRVALSAQPAVVELLLEALDGATHHSRAELVLGEEGPGRTVGFSLAPVRDDWGLIRGAALFFRDLSAIERMNERARMGDRLAALGEMAARMAHEIRNPLAGMKVMAELLERRLDGHDDELSLLAELRTELNAVDRVVAEGLEFVRGSSPVFQPVHPLDLVDRSLRRALARVPFQGSVECDFEDGLPAISADPDQLVAVLTNLIVNALEAMDPGAGPAAQRLFLRVAAREADPVQRPYRVRGGDADHSSAPIPGEGAGRELLISVGDTGPGVSAELRERVFYPFFTTKPTGSGVGLSTAQRLVTDHGGRIELDASTAAGAVFHVRLPLVEAEEKSTAPGEGSGAAS
ncbi:MAG: PAS domain-containing protein [Deltaproteobacteria bacterium]|nr:PAS domain-containing protein [Deltaproteobacteria bacterium]MBW2698135.1 PAS domain-containing protein [Deltaproteobacteria bacterium]